MTRISDVTFLFGGPCSGGGWVGWRGCSGGEEEREEEGER